MGVTNAIAALLTLIDTILKKFTKTVDEKIRHKKWTSKERAKEYLKRLSK